MSSKDSGPLLVANVHDGPSDTWYGPDYGNADEVPAEVSARWDNPAIWAEGRAPEPAPELPAKTGPTGPAARR